MFVRILVFLIFSAASSADEAPTVPTVDNEGVRCPGDNVPFWEEAREAGWLGYGETWDLFTCDQGVPTYAPDANRRWEDMRTIRLRDGGYFSPESGRFYSNIVPVFLFGTMLLVFVGAWAAAWFVRRREQAIPQTACSSCSLSIPISPLEVGLFCPRCGTPVVGIQTSQ